ncbi:MAG: 5-(carboxyamino)imidazole ribonucleotide mutase [Oscillospiraceae bacterium]|nr:5-(carboxyamino)imidazole ribonucleotide mutase [Oscillospiraceae bacterium]
MVSIIMGSESDLSVMRDAGEVLKGFGIPFEMKIISAHRTPFRMAEYSREAAEHGVRVIIAGAGGAAHLPGMVAAMTVLPVIGVPVKSAALNGVDSLYSIVQMPYGVPVATMAINGAKNAALFAARMLGAFDKELAAKLESFMQEMERNVIETSERVENIGKF